MAATGTVTAAARRGGPAAISRVTMLRIALIVGAIALWEAVAASGLLFRDVVPSLVTIGQSLIKILTHPDFAFELGSAKVMIPDFYRHLWVTFTEVGTALLFGGLAGLVVGLALGANPFLSRAFERFFYYLGPTPKIIFFPLMIMWFGVGPDRPRTT